MTTTHSGGAHALSDALRQLARRASKLRRVARRDTARAEAVAAELDLTREQLENATDTVRGLARRATGYRSQLRVLGVDPVTEDLSTCPLYRSEPGPCRAGCSIEPRCLTHEPDTGWPLTHHKHPPARSNEPDDTTPVHQ